MQQGMLPVPGVVRRLVPALAAAAVVAVPLLPATAQAQEPAGRTVVGELIQAWPEVEHDSAGGAAEAAQPITWVETADGESVRIPTEDAGDLSVGATVEVTVGTEVREPEGQQGLDPAHRLIDGEVVAEAKPVAVVTNQVTVALVAPRGVEHDGVLPEQVAAAVDGPVATFWAEQTDGAVDLQVDQAHGWVDTTVGCGNPGRMWDQAAREVGFEPGPGKHLLLYLSSAAPKNCAYGLAEIGSHISSGGRAYVRDVLPSLIAHELGHNFGLGHSSALHCAHGAETGGCDVAAYRDLYDVMGASWQQVGTLNAVQAATLGLLDASAQQTLTADGSSAEVTLAPLSGTDGVRAVRLVGHAGRQYWLELRTPAAPGPLARHRRRPLRARGRRAGPPPRRLAEHLAAARRHARLGSRRRLPGRRPRGEDDPPDRRLRGDRDVGGRRRRHAPDRLDRLRLGCAPGRRRRSRRRRPRGPGRRGRR